MANRTTNSLNESILSGKNDTQNYWGFANFPNQIFRRAVKNGFDFTLMVVGRSGLGKSTFINTLFLAEINNLKEENDILLGNPLQSTVHIEEKLIKLEENGVTLNLTLVDTPGFGDAVNNSKCWEPIVNFVDGKFFDQFCEETQTIRETKVIDKCVHLCLYFIEPSGHGLKPIDIELMKNLHERVNIVPVIAKADCLTRCELLRFKLQIEKDAEAAGIILYKFPELEDPIKDKDAAEKLLDVLPFAIIGSNSLKEKDGKWIRYREYPWGTVEVENMEHNDFLTLRDMIIRKNLIDMIDVTRNVHYENYRFRQMEGLPKNEKNRDPFTYFEEERRKATLALTKLEKQLHKENEERTIDSKMRNEAKSLRLKMKQETNEREIKEKKAEIKRLLEEMAELRNGNLSASQTSLLSMYSENNHSQNNSTLNSTAKTSPSHHASVLSSCAPVRKRLGIFHRN